MKKNITVGLLMMLFALWGGSYTLSVLPLEHWASFPSVMTAAAIAIIGICLIIRDAEL